MLQYIRVNDLRVYLFESSWMMGLHSLWSDMLIVIASQVCGIATMFSSVTCLPVSDVFIPGSAIYFITNYAVQEELITLGTYEMNHHKVLTKA